MIMRVLRLLLLMATVSLIACSVTGCGEDQTSSSPAATTATDAPTTATGATAKADAAMKADAPPKRKRGQTEIQSGSVSGYGKILQDGKGHTIYLFTKEKSSKSECYGACADAWPPVTTKGTAFAGKGVTASKLGTTKRDGGGTQVTYNGHPLYYYVGETEADQVLCQAVSEFGGLWYIVNKRGKAITYKA